MRGEGIIHRPIENPRDKKSGLSQFAGKAAGLWDGKFYAAVACALACGAGVVAGAGAGGCGPLP